MMRIRSQALLAVLLLAACGGDGGGPTTEIIEVAKWTPSGENQTGAVMTTLPLVLRVKVTVNDEVSAGHTVTWTGVGTFGTPSGVTDANGVATTTWTMPEEAGSVTAEAAVSEAVGSPVIFHATSIPGPPTILEYVSGDHQAQQIDKLFNQPFVVRVADQYFNGVDGVYVHWSVSGPATVVADSVITTLGGYVNGYLTAGDTEGAVTLTATRIGLTGSPLEFTAAVVGPPEVIEVRDNYYSPATVHIDPGQSVKWTWIDSGHSVSSTSGDAIPTTPLLDAGAVRGPILFTTAGTYNFECTVHGGEGMTGTVIVDP